MTPFVIPISPTRKLNRGIVDSKRWSECSVVDEVDPKTNRIGAGRDIVEKSCALHFAPPLHADLCELNKAGVSSCILRM